MVAGPHSDPIAGPSPESRSLGLVRRISWSEIFPWLLIFRSFTIAASPTVILLATVGLLLTPIGWIVAEFCFIGDEMAKASPEVSASVEYNESLGNRVQPSGSDFEALEQTLPWNSRGVFMDIYNDFVGPYRSIVAIAVPPRDAETGEVAISAFGMRRFAYFACGGLWMLVVWSFVAGCISRIAVIRLSRDERVGLKKSIRFTIRHYLSLVGAPLMPLSIVLLFILLMVIPGLLMRLDLGALIVSLIWGFLLLIGFLITLLLLVLSVCWPLMAPTISTESSDAFDAITRSFSYIYYRPLHAIFYASLGIILLSLGGLLAGVLGDGVIHVTRWGASWGAGSDRMTEIAPVDREDSGDDEDEDAESGMLGSSVTVFGFWENIVRAVRTGFLYGLFWCVASATYLVLRRSVDETEIDDVHYDGDDQLDELPPLEPPPAVDEGIKPKVEPAKDESKNDESKSNESKVDGPGNDASGSVAEGKDGDSSDQASSDSEAAQSDDGPAKE